MKNQIDSKKLIIVKYRETQKFNDWTKFFFDRKNKETYGNATQSALKVYDVKSYESAGVIGHENLINLSVCF